MSQAVAMKISGHRTASVYRRYRIVDENDIQEALAKAQDAIRQAPGTPNVTPPRAAMETR